MKECHILLNKKITLVIAHINYKYLFKKSNKNKFRIALQTSPNEYLTYATIQYLTGW